MTARLYDLQKDLVHRLAASETAALEAQVILAHVLGRSRVWLLAHPEAELESEQIQAVENLSARLVNGEPLPYLLGHWEFYGLDFYVTPQVLIPRPETELLVEQALRWLKEHPGRRRVADVGVGSGCISVATAVHVPDLWVLGTDISAQALQTAKTNAARHEVFDRIRWVQADLLPIASGSLDLICANPPYIPSEPLASLKVSAWEPHLALDGGPDGLDVIRRLLEQAKNCLAPGGGLLCEIEASQGQAVQALGSAIFQGARVQVLPDLAGKDRLLAVQLKNEGGHG